MLKEGKIQVIDNYNLIKFCNDGDVEIWEGCHHEGGVVTSRYEHLNDKDFIADLSRAFKSMSFYTNAVKTEDQQAKWISAIKKYIGKHPRDTGFVDSETIEGIATNIIKNVRKDMRDRIIDGIANSMHDGSIKDALLKLIDEAIDKFCPYKD